MGFAGMPPMGMDMSIIDAGPAGTFPFNSSCQASAAPRGECYVSSPGLQAYVPLHRRAALLPIFLVRVLHGHVFVHEVLPVHVRDRVVGGFECAVGDKP